MMSGADGRYLLTNCWLTYNIGRMPVRFSTMLSQVRILLNMASAPPIFLIWAFVGSTSSTGGKSPLLNFEYFKK